MRFRAWRQLDRIKREQESAKTFEAVAKEWLVLKDWEEITKNRRLENLGLDSLDDLGWNL